MQSTSNAVHKKMLVQQKVLKIYNIKNINKEINKQTWQHDSEPQYSLSYSYCMYSTEGDIYSSEDTKNYL